MQLVIDHIAAGRAEQQRSDAAGDAVQDERACVERGAAEQGDEADEAGASDGASQLIPGVGRRHLREDAACSGASMADEWSSGASEGGGGSHVADWVGGVARQGARSVGAVQQSDEADEGRLALGRSLVGGSFRGGLPPSTRTEVAPFAAYPGVGPTVLEGR